MLGRDAQDTQRLARRWRSLAYRDPPRSVADGRLEQVEHEALATLMAAQAGVRVPEVLMAALGPSGTHYRHAATEGRAARESARRGERRNPRGGLGPGCRCSCAGISHGRLNASNVVVLDEGPMLVDLSAATLGAPQSALDIDVAELVVASTVLVGPDRALQKAIDAGWGDAVGRVLPYLQRAALTPASPRPRTHARGRPQETPDRRGRSDWSGGSGARAAAPRPPQGSPDDRGVGLCRLPLIGQLADIGFRTISINSARQTRRG